MSFVAKREKKAIHNQRQTHTSHCPTKTISKTKNYPLSETLNERGRERKNQHPVSFAAKGKKIK